MVTEKILLYLATDRDGKSYLYERPPKRKTIEWAEGSGGITKVLIDKNDGSITFSCIRGFSSLACRFALFMIEKHDMLNEVPIPTWDDEYYEVTVTISTSLIYNIME